MGIAPLSELERGQSKFMPFFSFGDELQPIYMLRNLVIIFAHFNRIFTRSLLFFLLSLSFLVVVARCESRQPYLLLSVLRRVAPYSTESLFCTYLLQAVWPITLCQHDNNFFCKLVKPKLNNIITDFNFFYGPFAMCTYYKKPFLSFDC